MLGEGGAIVFEISSGKLNLEKNFALGSTVLSMLKVENNVWIGTYSEGLFKYNIIDNTIKNYTTANGLLSNSITSLLNYNNTLLLGTGESGIDFFDLKNDKVLENNLFSFNNKELSSLNIYSIYHDKLNNCIWIATADGLNKFSFNTKTIQKYYNEESPTTSSNFYSILPDSNNHLWLSTNKGLVKFNINAQNNDAAFVNYTTADGLQGMEFNQGAYFKDEKGILYFGGLNGFTYFNPREITARKGKLPVFFTNYFNGYKEVKLDTAIAYKKHIKLSHKENSVKLYFNSIDYDHPEKIKYSFILEGYDDDWRPASQENYADYPLLPPGDYVFKVVAINSDGYVNPEAATMHISISPPWYKTKLAYFTYLFLVVFIGWGYGQLRSARANRQNRKLEKTVEQRTRQLAEKNKDITSSIEYARKIQEALLPATDEIKKGINNLFIFYQPRDIVSGDFYWYYQKGDKKIIAVVDCTGHGVPGAFMSMIGHNLLNQIVIERGILKPSEILNELHKGIEKALKQSHTNSESRDGMDVSVCMLQNNCTIIEFAGAYRSLIKISGDTEATLEKINGDKYPVGGVQMGETRNFTNHILHLSKGDMIYMFTDGYADQFGGTDGKKYMMKSFGELLKECSFLSVEAQQEIIANNFNNWKKSYEQIDDVLVVGIRV